MSRRFYSGRWAADVSAPPAWVAGVDGCPAGWIVALLPMRPDAAPRLHVAADFASVLALPEQPARIAVDMPIGLAERVGLGGRSCDVEARKRLGDRQSSVFTVPARAAVMETEYAPACAVALEHSDPPRKVSKQCFNLFPKMREIDAVMTPLLQERVFECHPELAFTFMNGERPLHEPKKVKSRPYEPGLSLRRTLLANARMPVHLLDDRPRDMKGVGEDDILDALACAWSAARALQGKDVCLPADPPHDQRRLRMEIRA